VGAFSRPTIAQALLGETDNLLASLGEQDNTYICVADFQVLESWAAILIIIESERRNLDRFGDIIWLDGTTFKKNIVWISGRLRFVAISKVWLPGRLLYGVRE
jgi:hypothetical protein